MSSFADNATTGPCPSTLILLRTRNGLSAFRGPSSEQATDAVISRIPETVDGITGIRLSPQYSPDGSILCIVRDVGPICLYNSVSGTLVGEIVCLDASYVDFSPKGTYMITWSKAVKGNADGAIEGNLKVWSVLTQQMVVAYSQKSLKKDALQFSADESLCYRMVSNEVHVLNGADLCAGTKCKVYHKGLSQFKASPSTSPFASIAVFNSDVGGNPAKVTLYRYSSIPNEVQGPVSCRTMFSASEASMVWSATGSALLVHTHSDVDKSNNSYYGTSGLFLLSSDGNLSVAVPQSKEGQIHEVKWSPAGDRFVVAAGNMPCHCTLFNHKAESVYEFGAAHRNTISWSPHGRFLLLAGFGNLAGEMDFYDTLRLRKIGSNTAHCSVSHGWSPCSRFFLCATLAPRMNVDNGFKIFKYNGLGPVAKHEVEQAFDAVWRPAAQGTYPPRGPSPKREGDMSSSNVPAPAPKVQAYRAPGSNGFSALSDMMKRGGDLSSAAGKVKHGAGTGAGGRGRTVPGMAPISVSAVDPAKAAAKKEADKKKKADKKAQAELEAAEAALKSAVPSPGPLDVSSLSSEEKEKRAKAVRKKLKAVEEVKDKQKAGAKLDAGQVAKLGTEAELVKELALLSI